MVRQPVHTQRSLRKLAEADGWTATVGGKHQVKMTKPGRRPVTLPHHKGRDYPTALTAQILKELREGA